MDTFNKIKILFDITYIDLKALSYLSFILFLLLPTNY